MRRPVPVVEIVEREGEVGYFVGVALDELAAFALEEGCSEAELRERLDEAIEKAPE